MAYQGSRTAKSKVETGDTVKWTRPTISVPGSRSGGASGTGNNSLKSNGSTEVSTEKYGHYQVTASNVDTVSFTRPTVTMKNMKDNRLDTKDNQQQGGAQNKPRKWIKRGENVKSSDQEYLEKMSYEDRDISDKGYSFGSNPAVAVAIEGNVCIGRPTINLQGKLSQEKSKDGQFGQESAASEGFNSLADRAKPAPMIETTGWASKPKAHQKLTENPNMSQKYNAHVGDTTDVNQRQRQATNRHLQQQQQHGMHALHSRNEDVSWTRPTIDVTPKVQMQQQNGDRDQRDDTYYQQEKQNDDSMSWMRPTITVKHKQEKQPTEKKPTSQYTGQDAGSESLVKGSFDIQVNPPKAKHRFDRQVGVTSDPVVSQQKERHDKHDKDTVSWQRPTIAVKPDKQKQYGGQNQESPSRLTQKLKVPTLQHGSQDGEVMAAWTRPTIDVKPNKEKQRQYGDQNRESPPRQTQKPKEPTQHHGYQDVDEMSWTRPTIDVKPKKKKVPTATLR